MRILTAFAPAALVLAGLGNGPRADEPKAQPERPADARAIAELNAAFTRAFNQGDARAVAALFTEQAEIVEESGTTIKGRDAIAQLFATGFEAEPKATIELTTESLRFLGADAARETGRARTIPAGGGAPEITRYTVLFVRRDGRWLQDFVTVAADRALTAHDRLKELEWLVGDWVDESDEGIVHTSCRWSDDQNFLVREFRLHIAGQPFTGGSQRIGWDPRAEQFKSWVFDSDGGQSEGLWSRSGKDRWLIKASGVLADGKTVTATHVLTFVNKGMARWHSVDRTVGGVAVPDLPEIVLVRTPPKPAPASIPAPSKPRKP